MANKFASGKIAIAECDVCGQRYKLKQLKALVIRTKITNILACPECWNPDHPQNLQGMYPVEDPQALQNPRRDNTYIVSGVNYLGALSEGSRQIQWGWNPVGFQGNSALTPNDLAAVGVVGTVEVTIT